MSVSNFQTNTGHRFISKAKTAFKLHIHRPDDSVLHRSVGYIRLGEEAGLKKAIALRDTLGRELWGKHWRRVLNEPELFTRLPHSLEPALVHKPTPTGADPYKRTSYYLAKWMEYDVNGERVLKSKLASIEKLGKLAAYNQAKRILMQAYKDDIEILSYMGRFNIVRVM